MGESDAEDLGHTEGRDRSGAAYGGEQKVGDTGARRRRVARCVFALLSNVRQAAAAGRSRTARKNSFGIQAESIGVVNLLRDFTMKIRVLRTLGISLAVICSAFYSPVAHMNSQENRPDYKNPKLPVDRRVADLLSRMTIEEKVAQLTCLWGGRPQVGPQTDFSTDRGEFSPAKAAEVMKYGIGQ